MADEKEINQPTGTATTMGEETEQSAHKTAAQKMNNDARLATEKEHNMTLWQGIKLYPKAVAWSLLISTCIAMEGYDLCLLSNFYGFPQFNRYVIRLSLPKICQVTAVFHSGICVTRRVPTITVVGKHSLTTHSYGCPSTAGNDSTRGRAFANRLVGNMDSNFQMGHGRFHQRGKQVCPTELTSVRSSAFSSTASCPRNSATDTLS
jgi:hypothetical protein